MGNYKKFEELPCWQKTRELCKAVSTIINKTRFQKDSNLNRQIWKAAGSAMDNIVYDLASECRIQIKGFRKYLRNYMKD